RLSGIGRAFPNHEQRLSGNGNAWWLCTPADVGEEIERAWRITINYSNGRLGELRSGHPMGARNYPRPALIVHQ
ncbi:hypothetical protein AALA58_10415, partial [Lactococcus ileimucosae]